MSFWNLLRELRGCPAARRSLRRPRQASRSCRPVLEALEDRCLLSYSVADLGTLAGSFSYAYGINASGQVVGQSTEASFGFLHAFATPPMQDIGTLGGNYSVAYGINSSGQVVGESQNADYLHHAFLYDATATPAMQDLGTFGGWTSQAYGINSSGQVVGDAYTPDNLLCAFVYDGTAMLDLNGQIPAGSGWNLQTAQAINDNGQIVGKGLINGNFHAFLLTPDPGPGPGPAPHGTLASLATRPVPVNTAFVVGGGSMLAADATLASTAPLGPVLAAFDRVPLPAPRAPTVSDLYVDAVPALAPQVAVTPEQRASLHLGSVHAADGLDQLFADLGQDMWPDGGPIS
jgi:probable HAF family extracellular repeat protein